MISSRCPLPMGTYLRIEVSYEIVRLSVLYIKYSKSEQFINLAMLPALCKTEVANTPITTASGLLIGKDSLTYEGIDGLKSGLHGLSDGFSRDNTGGLELNSLSGLSLNGAETIDGNTEGIDNSSEESLANGDIDNGSGSLNDISFLDFSAHR